MGSVGCIHVETSERTCERDFAHTIKVDLGDVCSCNINEKCDGGDTKKVGGLSAMVSPQ